MCVCVCVFVCHRLRACLHRTSVIVSHGRSDVQRQPLDKTLFATVYNVCVCVCVVCLTQGGTTSNPTACCPHGVTRRSTLGSWQPPAGVACTSDLSVSPFSMAQAFVSNLYAGEDGTQYVDYVMNLTLNTACREGPGSCCGMQLDDLQIKVLDTVQIKGTCLRVCVCVCVCTRYVV